ncbi:MAG: ATL73-like RING-H2 finger protein [Sylvanvirus sp.]|uniref:ATL73-like RING-H2 finger protein n=1 Tax=Sylvanvirus sp. TaxID=2487774 RepID=A0A3G5AJM6_9VIRU|nr:MAG: ATL73-like RING-H2 finger protein [Sylvanvirus sp.]
MENLVPPNDVIQLQPMMNGNRNENDSENVLDRVVLTVNMLPHLELDIEQSNGCTQFFCHPRNNDTVSHFLYPLWIVIVGLPACVAGIMYFAQWSDIYEKTPSCTPLLALSIPRFVHATIACVLYVYLITSRRCQALWFQTSSFKTRSKRCVYISCLNWTFLDIAIRTTLICVGLYEWGITLEVCTQYGISIFYFVISLMDVFCLTGGLVMHCLDAIRVYKERRVQRAKELNFPIVQLPVHVQLDPNSLFDTCTLCCTDYQPGEKVREFPICKHRFHEPCFEPMLQSSSLMITCPNCRCQFIVSV